MGPRIKLGILVLALGLVPGMAMAEPPEDYWKRTGAYTGLTGFYAFGQAFQDEVTDSLRAVGAPASTSTRGSGGLSFYGGYRYASWGAVDVSYDWVDNMTWNVAGLTFDYATHSWAVNGKFYLPMWRFQPYLNLGFGTQYADLGFTSNADSTSWGILGRPGAGFDFWINRNLVLKAEVMGFLPTNAMGFGTNNLYYMTAGGGIEYHF